MVSKLGETVLIGSKSGSQLVIMRVHLIQFQINEDEKTIQKLQHDQEISLQEVSFLMIEITLNEQAQFFYRCAELSQLLFVWLKRPESRL